MIFILDNFDSFTYNLYQYFGELGEQVVVRRRDECTLDDIAFLNPDLIVISPGPCDPADAPLALAVLERFKGKIPILGICLGHQAIGQVFGAAIKRASAPVHGKICTITHDGQGVFANLPCPLTVTRYHSLAIDRESLPPELVITATSDDEEIMGVRHRDYPLEGVQFHPEAILTEAGHALLQNAVNQARAWKRARLAEAWHIRPLALSVPPIRLLPALRYADFPFFLDSGQEISDAGRYSFLGAWPFLVVTAYRNNVVLHWPNRSGKEATGCLPVNPASGTVSPENGADRLKGRFAANMSMPSFPPAGGTLAVLDRLVAGYRVDNLTPFPFAGGAVGFFSYDLKDELERLPSLAEDDLHIPLWRLAWYDGIAVYDHAQEQYFLVACGMGEDGSCVPELAKSRLDRLEDLLRRFVSAPSPESAGSAATGEQCRPCADSGIGHDEDHDEKTARNTGGALNSDTVQGRDQEGAVAPVEFTVSREDYLCHLRRVIEYIYAGDIYQANLTQRFDIPWDGDPWQLYEKLHHSNPAPFAAFLPYEDFQILSCSPERFITIDREGRIETRPIKGTRPRGQTPEEDRALAEELLHSVKDRAELTMIIDLERNDIGRICEFGSVQVEDLIRLEKYPTVWHLVSTISGRLRKQIKPSDILKAVFPGGSITGAPKIRAMEIIEELEPYKRGVYTGSIGYLGFDGCWDLNIAIRTIIVKDGKAYVHAGGGIVADSVPELEYEETLHKALALFRGLGARLK